MILQYYSHKYSKHIFLVFISLWEIDFSKRKIKGRVFPYWRLAGEYEDGWQQNKAYIIERLFDLSNNAANVIHGLW